MAKALPISSSELQEVALFSTLTDTQLRMLCGFMRRENFSTGAALLTVGEPAQRVYVLQSGTMKVCIARSASNLVLHTQAASAATSGLGAGESDTHGAHNAPSGIEESGEERRTVVLNLCGAGEVLGEMSALDGQGCSAGVVALEPCRTILLDAPVFRDCVEQMTNLALALLHATRERLRYATRQLYAHSSFEATGRLAAQLLFFAERYGEETPDGILIPLRLVQRDLADIAASSRTRVNAAVTTLRSDGCLDLPKAGTFLIRNRERLAAHCQ